MAKDRDGFAFEALLRFCVRDTVPLRQLVRAELVQPIKLMPAYLVAILRTA